MSIDWNSILSKGFIDSIPLISKVFTAPFILCISICGFIGGAIFRSKEGATIGSGIGLFIASALGFLG